MKTGTSSQAIHHLQLSSGLLLSVRGQKADSLLQ